MGRELQNIVKWAVVVLTLVTLGESLAYPGGLDTPVKIPKWLSDSTTDMYKRQIARASGGKGKDLATAASSGSTRVMNYGSGGGGYSGIQQQGNGLSSYANQPSYGGQYAQPAAAYNPAAAVPQQGYNAPRPQQGYNAAGYNAAGYNGARPQPGYNAAAIPQQGYNAAGYNGARVPQQGYNAAVAPQQGYNAAVAPQQGYNAAVAPQQGYNAAVAPQQGYNAAIAPQQGYNAAAAPQQSYNAAVAPQQGYNAAIAPQQGYNAIAAGVPAPTQINFGTNQGYNGGGVSQQVPASGPIGSNYGASQYGQVMSGNMHTIPNSNPTVSTSYPGGKTSGPSTVSYSGPDQQIDYEPVSYLFPHITFNPPQIIVDRPGVIYTEPDSPIPDENGYTVNTQILNYAALPDSPAPGISPNGYQLSNGYNNNYQPQIHRSMDTNQPIASGSSLNHETLPVPPVSEHAAPASSYPASLTPASRTYQKEASTSASDSARDAASVLQEPIVYSHTPTVAQYPSSKYSTTPTKFSKKKSKGTAPTSTEKAADDQ